MQDCIRPTCDQHCWAHYIITGNYTDLLGQPVISTIGHSGILVEMLQ